jgi:xyloglucan-specific exo-beta-1,4-glucanase
MMMTRLKSVFVLFLSGVLGNAYAQTESYQWSNVAIGGGGFVSGIITSKAEQNLIYIRTDVGGAYRWHANDEKWIPLLDWTSENELGFQGVESIAIDPVEPSKVYMLVGTSYFNNGKTAILRSSDYGNTFSIVDVTSQFKAHANGMGRQTGEKLVVDPNSTNILFCGTRANGLFKSTNAGVSWSLLSGLEVTTTPNQNGISFVVVDPSSGSSGSASQMIIAGISRTGTNLYQSVNGGTAFTAISGGPTTLMPHRAVLANDRDLYITYANNAGPWDITGSGQIWKYNLTSGVWTDVTPSGFSGAFGGISVDPANPERLIASSINTYQAQDGSWGDRIFLSTNGGTTWTDIVAAGFSRDENGISWIEGQAIHWAGSIEFDPFDTRKAWVVSGNGVFQTDNIEAATNVWKFKVEGLEETVPLDIVSVPNGPLFSAIGDYDGFRHTNVNDYAPIHTPRMGTTSGIAVAAQNPEVALRAGEKTFYSTDNGITWTETAAKAGTKGSVALSADGKVFVHCPEGSSTTYRSINRGTNWSAITGLSVSGARPVADPLNINKFYAYNNSNGNVLVSTNGAVSFSAAGSAGSGGSKVIRAAPGREGDLWIALYNGGLTRSINSGASFNKINSVTTCTAVGFGKEATGKSFPTVYIWGTVGGVVGIHRSIDEGVTWQRINDDAHEYGGPANGQFVIGDMNVFGRAYMSTAGRGIVFGESDQTCVPDNIVPFVQLNEGVKENATWREVAAGDDVVLSPEPAVSGIWSWTGPGGFSSTSRELSLSDIQAVAGGIYTARFTNNDGCVSAPQTFTIVVTEQTVLVTGITVKGAGDATKIDVNEGTLQMEVVVGPANATNKAVTWSITANDDLALLSPSGLLTAQGNGVVTVRATATDGSAVFDEIEITISNQTITDVEQPGAGVFELYPNPVSSILRIRNDGSIKQIKLMDVSGRTLLANDSRLLEIFIPVHQFENGLYLIQITDKQNRKFVKRVVKQ